MTEQGGACRNSATTAIIPSPGAAWDTSPSARAAASTRPNTSSASPITVSVESLSTRALEPVRRGEPAPEVPFVLPLWPLEEFACIRRASAVRAALFALYNRS
ncbi:MAG: hypothetical protein R2789_10250 [Microthrixaceae bacterium]